MRIRGIYYGWIVAGLFFITAFAGWGTAQGTFGVFVNPLGDEMGWSRTAVSAAFSINIAVGFLFGALWGWLADRWSMHVVLGLTGGLLGLGVFLGSTANSLWYFYLFYGVVAGTGLGGIAGPVSALIARWFEDRPGMGLALGLGTAGIHAGVAVLPVLSQYVISHQDWRTAFQVLSYVIWGALLVGAILARSPKRKPAVPGGASDTIALAPAADGDSVQSDLSLAAASRTAPFWSLFTMLLAGFVLVMMVVVHLVPRAEDTGVSSSTAATLLTTVGILSMVGAVVGGVLVDRLGARRVYIGAMLIETAAFVWLTYSSSLWMFYVFAVVFGASHGSWSPQMAAIIAKVFGIRHMGAIYGAALLGAGIGAVIGPIMAGLFFDLSGSYRVAFALSAVIAGFAVVLGLLLSDRPLIHPRASVSGGG